VQTAAQVFQPVSALGQHFASSCGQSLASLQIKVLQPAPALHVVVVVLSQQTLPPLQSSGPSQIWRFALHVSDASRQVCTTSLVQQMRPAAQVWLPQIMPSAVADSIVQMPLRQVRSLGQA
jgi:hypothetical protein